MARERKLIGILGAAGTGKTSVAATLVGRAMSRRERVTILDPNAKLVKYFPSDPEGFVRQKIEHQEVDCLLLDDADAYVAKSLPKKSIFRQLGLRYRHLGVDLVWSGRKLALVPSEILSSLDVVYVFCPAPTDRANKKALVECFGDLPFPKRPYEFLVGTPKTVAPWFFGRTKPGGGYQILGEVPGTGVDE